MSGVSKEALLKDYGKPKQKYQGFDRKQNGAGYFFIGPLLVLFAVFIVYSFYFLIKTSFQNVSLTFFGATFVGWKNYLVVLEDPVFFRSLINTFFISAANIFAGLTLGFLVAVFLGFHFRGQGFFNSLFFIPSMLPIAFVATIFGLMFEYREGVFNNMIRFCKLGFLDWRFLSDPHIAIFTVMSVSIYLIGIPIMYYTAELSVLNNSIFEAAVIDGAKMKDMLLLILYPILKNTHKAIIISMILGGFREFERVFLMTEGGPEDATQIINTYIFRNTRNPGFNLGIIAATGVLILIIAFVVSAILLRINSRAARGGK